MARQVNLTIVPERCRACRPCLAAQACKVRAIVSIDPGEPPYLDAYRCIDCRLCIAACPFGAISASAAAGAKKEVP